MTIGIVTVNFGDCSDTIALWKSINQHPESNKFYLIIVDNNSGHDIMDRLTKEIKFNVLNSSSGGVRGEVVANEENLGFSGGNNVGLRRLMTLHDLSHIWIINNDTIVTRPAILEVISISEEDKDYIHGGTLIYTDSGLVQCLGGGKINKYTLTGNPIGKGIRQADIKEYDEDSVSEDLDYVHGACMVFPRRLIEKMGYMDEDYFLYYEEADFCNRALSFKYLLRWKKDLIVFHKEGSSINGTAYNRSRSKLSEYHSTKSLFIYTGKWHKTRLPFIIFSRILSKALVNIYRRRFLLTSCDIKAAWDYIKGTRDAF
jgi:GT2 family glycosyltransferase